MLYWIWALFFLMSVPALGAPFAYIPNSDDNTVSVIDTAIDLVTSTVPVGRFPIGVAITPQGHRVYVSNFEDNSVSVLDALTLVTVATIPVLPAPRWLAASHSRAEVYVAHATRPGYISVIDTRQNEVRRSLKVGNDLSGIATAISNPLVFAASTSPEGDPRSCIIGFPIPVFCNLPVTIIDAAEDRAVGIVAVGDFLSGIEVDAVRGVVYVANQRATQEFTTIGRVSVVDPVALSVSDTIEIGEPGISSQPNALVLHPDGTRLYVSGREGVVWVIDLQKRRVVDRVVVSFAGQGIDITPDGKLLYVANANQVSVVDTARNEVVRSIPVGAGPRALGHFIGPAVIATPTACGGDCDGDGRIEISELIVGVNVVLGLQPVDRCRALDQNGDGRVMVGELIDAVGGSLSGCFE